MLSVATVALSGTSTLILSLPGKEAEKLEKTLKNLLKKLKLNESAISTVLGAAVIIIVGILIFNYFKAEPQQSDEVLMEEEFTLEEGEPATESAEMAKEKSKPVPSKTYTVAKGDHLWKIAQNAYNDGYQWVKIAQANNLANPNYLEEGQELNIPELEKKQQVAEAEEEEEPVGEVAGEKAIEGDKYTVKKGDHLWKIAVEKYGDGYRWTDIANANNIANPDYIESGQELILPE